MDSIPKKELEEYLREQYILSKGTAEKAIEEEQYSIAHANLARCSLVIELATKFKLSFYS